MYDPLRAKAKVVFLTAVAFLFGLGVASGLGWTSVSNAMPAITTAPQVSEEAVRPALDLSEAFTNLAEAVTPAVVRIESRRMASRATANPGVQPDPELLRRFFPGLPDGDGDVEPRGRPAPRVAGGTGFVVSEDGYILTNNHVVSGAQEVTVYFEDHRQFSAEIVGTDPFTDVAVIKIDAGERLPTMAFGNSDDVKVGEWILAIGNPGFGGQTQLNFTVTAGIISARGRGLNLLRNDLFRDPRYGSDQASWSIEDFIQTDAVINPGNSGGPMVNLRGQAVGINSAIASETGVYQGYGFAIPINLARRVMEDLIEYGHIRRPRIGVAIDNVSPEDAELYGLPRISGVFIQEVQNGPAMGKLRAEDVIVAIDGEPVGYTAELQAEIAERHPGDVVTITVYRDRRQVDVDIQLDEAPINSPPPAAAPATPTGAQRLGIEVEPIDEENAEAYGFSEPGGVVLTDVLPGSAADRRRALRFQGSRLAQINDDLVETPEDVREALDRVESGDIVSLHLEDREGTTRVLNVRMP
ncbi:MAG: trypsin-like peptidase domain-containing protein [Gemmatimonadota bacterium]|jgi:serine protease Do